MIPRAQRETIIIIIGCLLCPREAIQQRPNERSNRTGLSERIFTRDRLVGYNNGDRFKDKMACTAGRESLISDRDGGPSMAPRLRHILS